MRLPQLTGFFRHLPGRTSRSAFTRVTKPYLPRVWQLRHNFSAYDAAYIVLAEKLGAAIVTRDARLASASGHAAPVELF